MPASARAIVTKRARFCDRLKALAADAHKRLTDGKENLEISYVTQIEGENAEEREKSAALLLSGSVEKDFDLGYTTSGCQRDDLKFCVNGADIRSFGSQGQQRTAALSLKLAELEIFKELTGDYPVLLLDDVLSELDLSRQKRLLDFCDRGADYSHRDAYRRGADSREGICGVPLEKRRGRAHKIV